MRNNKILKRQIVYRSTHRGTKEMDLLLGNFVKKNIDFFNDNELLELQKLMEFEDEILHKWYFDKIDKKKIPMNKVSEMLKNFKF
tara:strand:+ start:1830 stop:2084 length:255 start_codon:yes stop_codon:yes gene_type:complete